jgi:hypothetical protein
MDRTLSRRQFLAAGAAATVVPSSWATTNLEPIIERKRSAIRKAISEHGIPGGAVADVVQHSLASGPGKLRNKPTRTS